MHEKEVGLGPRGSVGGLLAVVVRAAFAREKTVFLRILVLVAPEDLLSACCLVLPLVLSALVVSPLRPSGPWSPSGRSELAFGTWLALGPSEVVLGGSWVALAPAWP